MLHPEKGYKGLNPSSEVKPDTSRKGGLLVCVVASTVFELRLEWG